MSSKEKILEGLTKSLAAELVPHIRVNAIAPSITDTPLAERLLSTDEKRKATAKRHPLNKIRNLKKLQMLFCSFSRMNHYGLQGKYYT